MLSQIRPVGHEVLDVLVILSAGIRHDPIATFATCKRSGDRPWRGEKHRIVVSDSPFNCVEIGKLEPLDQMQLVTVLMPGGIEPTAFVDAGCIDYQRISLPFSDRVSHELRIVGDVLGMISSIHVNDPIDSLDPTGRCLPPSLLRDPDTTLAPDAIEKLVASFEDPEVVAACGLVLPRHVRSIWERGRYIEYLFAFTFYKQVQDYYQKPLISSGCFSMYRTHALQGCGGWPTRTLAEDMDLTWTFYELGHRVRFVPEAVCYPIEPHDFQYMGKQLKRWSHGFVQNLIVHWRDVLHVPYLRSAVAVAVWDAAVASLVYLLLVPVFAIYFKMPWLLLGYAIDAPAILVPVLAGAQPRREVRKALASFPAFFILRTVNAVFFIRALWCEIIACRSFRVYEKGH